MNKTKIYLILTECGYHFIFWFLFLRIPSQNIRYGKLLWLHHYLSFKLSALVSKRSIKITRPIFSKQCSVIPCKWHQREAGNERRILITRRFIVNLQLLCQNVWLSDKIEYSLFYSSRRIPEHFSSKALIDFFILIDIANAFDQSELSITVLASPTPCAVRSLRIIPVEDWLLAGNTRGSTCHRIPALPAIKII